MLFRFFLAQVARREISRSASRQSLSFNPMLNTARLIAFAVIAMLSLQRTVHAAIASEADSILRKSGAFALGGVGVAGTMSEGERALRELLKQPDAVVRLEHMLPDASAPGQLYALLGLRLRDREAYQRALAKYGQRDVTVQTMRGCIVQQEHFTTLVKQIDHGDYDASLSREWPGPVR
jgi:hypothetical protein